MLVSYIVSCLKSPSLSRQVRPAGQLPGDAAAPPEEEPQAAQGGAEPAVRPPRLHGLLGGQTRGEWDSVWQDSEALPDRQLRRQEAVRPGVVSVLSGRYWPAGENRRIRPPFT